MVATDIFGRGIDIERVNIVVNYDMPDGADSYLHRVGRAGRFGTKGLAVTFVSSAEDSEILNKVQERFEVNITEMPETIDVSSYSTWRISLGVICCAHHCNSDFVIGGVWNSRAKWEDAGSIINS